MDISALVSDYHRDGYVSGVPILNRDEATYHRQALEDAEKQLDTSLHYQSKMHTIIISLPYYPPEVLDPVEARIARCSVYNV